MRLLIVFTTILLVLTVGGTVLACDCVTAPPEQSFEDADVVFEGMVDRITRSSSETAYTFRVGKMLKGSPASEVTVVEGFSDCDTQFGEYAIYRVYARRFEGKLSSGQCAGNKFLGVIRVNNKSWQVSWPKVFRLLSPVAVGLLAIIIWVLIRRRA